MEKHINEDREQYKVGDSFLVSAFPGTGKSHYCNVDVDYMPGGFAIDSDSSKFKKEDFPNNYMEHIRQSIVNGYSRIFISSHKDVRDALVEQHLPFVLIYPEIGLKDEYLRRYADRGSAEPFIKLISENWDIWIAELKNQKGCYHIELKSNEFVANVI